MDMYRVFRTETGGHAEVYIAKSPKREGDTEYLDLDGWEMTALQNLPGMWARLSKVKEDAVKVKDGTHPSYTVLEAREAARLERRIPEDQRDMTNSSDFAKFLRRNATRVGKGAAALALIAGIAGVAYAQTAMLGFGQETTNSTPVGTYTTNCNLSPATNVNTWNTTSITCGVQAVSNLNRLYSSAAWELWRSATALGSGATAAGVALVTTQQGTSATFNISAGTVVKASAGRIFRVNVITAGSTAGSVNNVTTTGAAATSNAIFTVPNTVGTYELNAPMTTGITVIPGTSQVIAVVYQ